MKGPRRQHSSPSALGEAEKDLGQRVRTQPVSKKNQSWTPVKGTKTDFIRDYCNREKTPQYITGLNSEYNTGKWQLIAKDQSGDKWMDNYPRMEKYYHGQRSSGGVGREW